MEKFTLAPTTREIVVNRAADAADDLFSYDPETKAQARSLGHLYIVGHTDKDNDTVGYLVSLVAAMAKREYYASQPAGDAKEAFARTLRKVNEVVEEFFNSNEVGVNIGIFAVAGGTLLVSRLGKFRILLSRDDKVVDVLKDVSLFSKEVIQKKRFSSIISGPIQASDRLLAYFPQLALTRREKFIKSSLGSLSLEEMNEQISEFGAKSKTFSASLLMIEIDQVPAEPEPEVMPQADPQATPRLAWSPRQGAKAPVAKTTASVDSSPGPVEQDPHGDTNSTAPSGDWGDGEAPNIIPAEFTHRSRSNPLSRAFRGARGVRIGSRGKAVVLALAVLIVIGSVVGLKSTIFTDEAAVALQEKLSKAADELKEVQSMLAQDNARGARALVLHQLTNLRELSSDTPNESVSDLTVSYYGVLNEIDRAEPASVTLIAAIPASEGRALMATTASGSDAMWVLADAPEGEGMVLITLEDGLIVDSIALEISVDLMIPAPPSILLANKAKRTIIVHGAPSGETILPTPDHILSADWFIDYAYVLTTSGIMKVSDLDTKKPVSKQWLDDVSELSPGAIRVAVDGDVWTLSTDGTLAKFFRGRKETEFQLSFKITENHDLLTSEEMPFIYVTDTYLKRVHVIDKENGQLIQTVTFETEQEISDVFMGPDFSLYILASDGKIWKVE